MLADHQRLVKELDAIMGGSATQPSLCDVVAYAPAWHKKAYEQGRRDVEADVWEQAEKMISIPDGWEFRPVERGTIQAMLGDIADLMKDKARECRSQAIRAQAGQEVPHETA